MITGIVAQEFKVLPRGTLGPKTGFVDLDEIFTGFVGTGLGQYTFPDGLVDDAEDFFTPELPQVLTSDALIGVWADAETAFRPRVTIDTFVNVSRYSDHEQIFLPDVRIPGFLLPQFYSSDDVIHPTPLQLDPGMLRAIIVFFDVEAIYEPIVYAAQTIFLPPYNNDDVVNKVHTIRAGGLGPPFHVTDFDTIPNFRTTQDGFNASLVVDTGLVLTPACSYDGIPQNVIRSNNNLTAEKNDGSPYSGARSTLAKDRGKWYFEVEIIKSGGLDTNCGIVLETASYEQMGGGTNCSVYFHRDNGSSYDNHGNFIGGPLRSNGQYWNGFEIGYSHAGDIVSVAANFDNHLIWFRRNGGLWNSADVPRYNGVPIPNADADPVLLKGGAAIGGGMFVPAVLMGDGPNGPYYAPAYGDKMTGNFGVPPFRYPVPAGFRVWESDPVFAGTGPDRFGDFVIGVPCTLDDVPINVTMTNGNLTAMHNSTNPDSGVYSTSAQNYGKYYFEVTVDQTHGSTDGIGLIDRPEGDFTFHSLYSTYVTVSNGGIISVAGTGKSIGACLVGDVVGVAVDLISQSITSGGRIWYRKYSTNTSVAGPWNGDVNADPATGTGFIIVPGEGSHARYFAPMVEFGGTGSSIGDMFTGNFGQSPYVMPKPAGYGIWPTGRIDAIAMFRPDGAVASDDTFPPPFIETANKLLYHPNTPAPADDVIYPSRSLGGNFHIYPESVPDIEQEEIKPAGYLATFDGENSPNVTVTNSGRRVTLASVVANTGARSASEQHSGKYYIEFIVTDAGAGSQGVGILGGGKTFSNMVVDGKGCVVAFASSGSIYSNNVYSTRAIGAFATSDVICCAFDLTGRRSWWRRNAGLWNGVATDNPSTNTGGIVMEGGLAFAPAVGFPSSGSTVGDSYTCNFGQAAFSIPVPTGFLGGWPNASSTQRASVDQVVPDDVNETTGYTPRVSPAILRPELLPDYPTVESVKLVSGTGGSPTLGPGFHDEVAIFVETIYPVPVIKALAAFLDEFQSVNATLSNGNLTATHTNTVSNSGARSISYKTTGKYYFEVTMTNSHGAFDCIGTITQAGTYTNLITGGTNCVVTYKNTGNIYSNNANQFKPLGAFTNGDVIGVAVDLTARKAWLRKNGGNWNGLAIGSENPITGLGGVTVAPTVGFAPVIGFGGSGAAAGDEMTLNVGGTPFYSPAPTGFGIWGLAADVPPVLDITTAVVLANWTVAANGLTATHVTAGAGNEGVRSRTTASSGKLYFEATIGPTVGLGWSVGVLLPTNNYQEQFTYQTGTTMVIASTGKIYSNDTGAFSSDTGKTLSALNNGAVLAVAVDLTARLGWFRKKQGGTGVVSNWNNDPLADPATGVGGVIIKTVLGTEMFGPSIAGGGGTAGDQVTLNFGQSAYTLAVPAGFASWVASK